MLLTSYDNPPMFLSAQLILQGYVCVYAVARCIQDTSRIPSPTSLQFPSVGSIEYVSGTRQMIIEAKSFGVAH